MVFKNLEGKIGSLNAWLLPEHLFDQIAQIHRNKELVTENRNRTRIVIPSLSLSKRAARAKLQKLASDKQVARDLAERLTRSMQDLGRMVHKRSNHPLITPLIAKGATHVYLGPLGRIPQLVKLHFVKLPEKHSGKIYQPRVGNLRAPIREG